MLKKISLLSLIVIIVFSVFGCNAESLSETTAIPCFPTPMAYVSIEQLLADIVISNLDEVEEHGRHSYILRNIRELYVPLSVPQNFYLSRIGIPFVVQDRSISLAYDPYSGSWTRRATFSWDRNRPTDEIRFAHNNERDGAFRAQHGYEFRVRVPTNIFTEQEIYDFSYAQPIIAWELQGNMISVSLQGVEGISVFSGDNNRIIRESTSTVFTRADFPLTRAVYDHHTLYKLNGENLHRVGYSWLVDAELGRYQYVLMPGMYTFRADGISGTPGLTVRHFDGGEAVSVVDYSDRLIAENASGFYLTVTEDAGDTDLSYLSANHIFAVSSHDDLGNAIQYLIDQGITEQTTITMTQDFTATGATIYVPVDA
ncbi:MAG: hypothetical protein FWC75_05950 [Oscillospiraceae bacterium]|nr:hypothetical protein [Oscillospiraceae bacterium]